MGSRTPGLLNTGEQTFKEHVNPIVPSDCGTHIDCAYGCPGCPGAPFQAQRHAERRPPYTALDIRDMLQEKNDMAIEKSLENEPKLPKGWPFAPVPASGPGSSPVRMLRDAADLINKRGEDRDCDGERSMATCVETFNALTGNDLTETEGWKFMVCLKLARADHPKFNRDDYLDGAAYMALAGESHEENGA